MDQFAERGIPQEAGEANKEPTKAEQAADLFTKGSVRFSGLTEPQAAYLAAECQRQDLDPTELQDALLAESGMITDLTGLANRMHEKHRPKPPTERWRRVLGAVRHYFQGDDDPREVSETDVARTVTDIFAVAARRMQATPEQLSKIMDEYPYFKNLKRSHKERLQLYSNRVDEILKEGKTGDQPQEEQQAALVKPARRLLIGK